jgi:hypothetical protein
VLPILEIALRLYLPSFSLTGFELRIRSLKLKAFLHSNVDTFFSINLDSNLDTYICVYPRSSKSYIKPSSHGTIPCRTMDGIPKKLLGEDLSPQ